MKALTQALAVWMVLAMALLTGCATNTVRNLVSKGDAGQQEGPGRTVVITKVDLPIGCAGLMEKNDRIAQMPGQAAQSLPGVRRLPEEVLLSRLGGRDPFGLSDSELAAAVLDAGADTVILVRVLGYGGELTIAFPPVYWRVTLDYAYHARMIDARTGALYLDAHRGSRAGQAYGLKGKDELEARFKADLTGLLGGAFAPGGAEAGKGS